MKDLFINDPHQIYLNSGTESKTPISILKKIEDLQHNYELNPTYNFVKNYELLWESQKLIAAFFNTNPENIFLRNNVTEVMNQFILGTELPLNSEILTTNLEYQAILNIIKYKAQKNNLSVKTVNFAVKNDYSKDEIIELIVNQFTSKTKMLVISHIFTGTGLAIPIRELSEITNKKGIILVVDGAHSCGALKIDFQDLKQVDFFAGNFHKWMMGPKGTAFGMAHPKHHESLHPLMAGWTTFEDVSPFDSFGGGSRFASKMIVPGTQNFCQFLGLNELIKFWQEQGEEKIRTKLKDLTSYTENLIKEMTPFKSLFPKEIELQGPLITFALPERLEKEGYQLMHRLFQEKKVQVASTKINGIWHLRISPHIYNTQSEMTEASILLKNI